MIIVSKLLTMKKKVEKYYNEKKLKKNVGWKYISTGEKSSWEKVDEKNSWNYLP
jgi:hypothetical protein